MTEELQDLLGEKETRLKRLDELKKIGIDPFPAQSKRTHFNKEVIEKFENLSISGQVVFLVGRIKLIRTHGGSSFLDLEDETSKIQLYFKKDILGEDKYGILKFLDLGDFIEVTGKVTKTHKGEITLVVENLKLLTKSLRPIPKFSGLKDHEERYRRRYLDLILNPEVRNNFRKQSQFNQEFRNYYLKNGFIETYTPVLEAVPGGAEADPFITHHNALDIDLYLRISLELYLKRLIVGGYEKVFEIGPVFRNEGMDTQHLQEFTLLESYEAYKELDYLISFIEDLYQTVIKNTFGSLKLTYKNQELDFNGKWPRYDYYELVQKYAGIDLSKFTEDAEALKAEIKSKHIDLKIEKYEGLGRVIDRLYKKTVRPNLFQPCVLINQPLSISPLAKKKVGDQNRVDRMQVLIAGVEVGNGFSELNDPIDQKNRFLEQAKLREGGDIEAQMMDDDFIEALEYGMPPTAGFGVGLERLFMLCANSESIRDTVFFPTMKPLNK